MGPLLLLQNAMPSNFISRVSFANRRGALIIVLAVQNPQNSQEQVDDIEIQADGGRNLLLHMVVSHDQLGVHQNISAEDQRTHNSIPELQSRSLREEHCHESKEDEHPERAKEVWHPASKVILGLAREQCQSQEDSEREYEGLHYDLAVVEGGYDADAVGFERGEASQEYQIGWVRFAFPEGE